MLSNKTSLALAFLKTDILVFDNVSVVRPKDESHNGCSKKTKHAKFSKKQTFLTP